MYLRSLTIHGLSDLPHFTVGGLGRTVTIAGPSPASSAVGDGLNVLFGALNADCLRHTLVRWGLIQSPDESVIDADPLPTQAAWTDRHRAKAIVSDLAKRRIHVAVDAVLDPPMAATLRSASATEPRLAMGLSDEPVVHLEVSAYFGASWDVLSISVQSVVIGTERFPCGGKDRAPWLTALLMEMGKRFACHNDAADHASMALTQMTSAVAQDYEGFVRFTKVVGDVRPVRVGEDAAQLMVDHRPIDRLGSSAVRAIRAAATATLHNDDIMWMDDPDPWSARLTESDHAPLEQLWTVDENGIDPSESAGGHRDVLRFGAAEE